MIAICLFIGVSIVFGSGYILGAIMARRQRESIDESHQYPAWKPGDEE